MAHEREGEGILLRIVLEGVAAVNPLLHLCHRLVERLQRLALAALARFLGVDDEDALGKALGEGSGLGEKRAAEGRALLLHLLGELLLILPAA